MYYDFIKKSNYKLNQLGVDLDVTEKNNRIKNLQIAKLQKQVEVNAKNSYLAYSGIGILILGLLVFYFMYNQNISNLKNRLINIAHDKLAIEKDKTQKSLSEKETLLKEIHHRVKNNMQLVISLLKIQARDTKQLSIDNFIEISENRIRSMALIHEYLYESENINYVNFEEYINRLSSSLLSSFSSQSDIKLETDIENAHFDIETSIPLGLIINELVINAFKHAFVGREPGTIKIQLFKKEGLHQLIVSDNGIGFVENTQKSTSIGLKIVKLLVSQINGEMQIKNDLGTYFMIQFNNNTNTNEQ
jgi:two-component system, sensor histidine kinase PdtaS